MKVESQEITWLQGEYWDNHQEEAMSTNIHM
jgi:hypothetical protein